MVKPFALTGFNIFESAISFVNQFKVGEGIIVFGNNFLEVG